MKLKHLLAVNHDCIELSCDDEIFRACKIIVRVQDMTGGERDTLHALFLRGPLFDGDVPSKTARDSLVEDGFAVRVVVKGEEGFNACTYEGGQAHRVLEADLPLKS